MDDLPGIVDCAPTDISIFDADNPRSAYNLVHTGVQKSIDKARKKAPELFDLDEKDLKNELRKRKAFPSPTDNRLRMNFWMAYEKAHAFKQLNMTSASIAAGACSMEYFTQTYMSRPEKVAWLLCPPASYTVRIQEGLSFALDRMRLILDTDPFDHKGKPNPQLMALQIKIYDLLEKRALGAIPQKIEQTNKNFNVRTRSVGVTDEQAVTTEIAAQTMVELDKKIRELERRDRTKAVIDVKSEETTVGPDQHEAAESRGPAAED